jgi:F-type H+-transporting ATPase subunit delta
MAARVLAGASRDAIVEAQNTLDAALASGAATGAAAGGTTGGATGGRRGAAAAGPDTSSVAEDLFAVTAVLAANPSLRKALTDPSRTAVDRRGLASGLFSGKVSALAQSTVEGLAASRWSASGDIVEATERLAVGAILAGAEKAGRLDAVEDELFRFGRLVGGNVGLLDAFSSRTSGADRKASLVETLLAGKAAPETVRLVQQAVALRRGRSVEDTIEGFVEAAAKRRSQLIAHVVTATPLTAAQLTRLASALSSLYDRTIRTTVEIDPDLVGGLKINVAGEVIDGSMLGKLALVKQKLVG